MFKCFYVGVRCDQHVGSKYIYRAFKKLQNFLCARVEADPRIQVLTAGEFTQLPPYFEKYLFEAPAFLVEDSASSLPIILDYRYTVKNRSSGIVLAINFQKIQF